MEDEIAFDFVTAINYYCQYVYEICITTVKEYAQLLTKGIKRVNESLTLSHPCYIQLCVFRNTVFKQHIHKFPRY